MKPCVIVVLVALAGAACGQSREEQQAEQQQKAAEQVQKGAGDAVAKGAEDIGKGVADLASGLSAAFGGDSSVKAVDPVSFKELLTVLPDLPGWERGKPTGERMTAPVNYAEASVVLKKGDAEVTTKITDSALNQILVAPFAVMLAGNFERESTEGYEKSIKIGDAPGFEKWNTESKSGDLMVVINKRFIVEVEGRGIDDAQVLRAVLDRVDLKKLASMQ
jgi:hypothetical protein